MVIVWAWKLNYKLPSSWGGVHGFRSYILRLRRGPRYGWLDCRHDRFACLESLSWGLLLMTEVLLIPSVELGQVVSFLLGGMVGLAFVITAATRWR